MRLFTWANRITVTRIGLLFFLVVLVYRDNIWAQFLAAGLAILVIVMDWLDGYLARKLDESTVLGSVLDIAGDRMIESVLWIILADLRLVPVWIPIFVISRTILTDSIRGYVLRFGYTAFGKATMMKSALGKFLTGSPWLRTPYAILKAFTFSWLLLFSVFNKYALRLSLMSQSTVLLGLTIGFWAAVITAVVCLVRGVPVIIEGVQLLRQPEIESEKSSDN